MNFDEVAALRAHSAAWRLLRADNAALVVGFLGRVFVDENVREISRTALITGLDDELYALNERLGAGTFPKSARAYLDDWAAPEAGWLRKYYPPDSDEPHFDATPAVEKAVTWVRSLQARSFIGTESRLNTVFELLRQMVFGTETSTEVRLAELHRRRAEIDADIAEVERGNVAVLDAAAQRDRYQQFAGTARELLSDFREVEANFRALDRDMRERIAAWDGAKGELLDEVLGDRSTIADSDQGKSFQAFYDFLLSHQKQTELADLLERVQCLAAITDTDPRLRHIHHDWLDAGERTQATVRQLSEQLRRFLDDQVWLENRRVMDILRSIESHSLALRDRSGSALTMDLDATAPAVSLPMERPLYAPSTPTVLDSGDVISGEDDFEATPLFEQVYVDPIRLSHSVRRALQATRQIGLAQIVAAAPLQQGLAELVTYLSLSDDTFRAVFDESAEDRLTWTDDTGAVKVATLPRVTFVRTTPTTGGT
ncbi:DUF3375 domain-containing protein [Rhodococcus sp. NCIMB 12038]|uniref:DUF3375 domain-containing protein n=1 Tax=Rhodococcus sp. NCIMB 12038 TaxID=933800 RepID=UPI000B3C687F|nr:DUF3375 domain-containing protein [Rhodococcus sp. NCIMB 12038]OUS91951.1 hypothetical protein CA951_31230 [Rhodococcus sp. NCIMB 12038]